MSDKLMAAAKAISGESLFPCLGVVFFRLRLVLSHLSFSSLFILDASGIMFDRDALEHGDALGDAAAAVEDRCATAAGSLDKARKVLAHFYKEVVPKGVVL